MPSSAAFVSLMMMTAAAPSLSAQQLPAVTVPSGRNDGLSDATFSSVVPGRGPVVGRHGAAVRQRHRRDLTRPEPVGDGLLGQVLRPDSELVLLRARDAAQPGDVLRGLAHRDVDVGDLAVLTRVMPRPGAALAGALRPSLGVGERRVVRVRPAVAAAVREPAHAFDARRDQHVRLAGLDRVEGHPGGLQRRRAVARHRGPGQVVVAEQHGDHPGHVEALLAAGQAAAEQQVVDVVRVELRHLGQRGRDHLSGQVVRPDTGEGTLERAANRGSRRRDDNCVGHGTGLLRAGSELLVSSVCRPSTAVRRARDVG